jgi:hypothetical protein
MVQRAAEGLGLELVPSRRCYALRDWLMEREAQVYPAEPGYMAGPLAPLAAGAAIVGAAFKSLGDIVRAQVDTMKQGIQTAASLSQAVRGAEQGAQDRALGVVRSHAGARRRLAFRGGAGAVGLASDMATGAGRGGVSLADAEAGVGAAFDASPDATDQTMIAEAAYLVARTGEMSMAEAVASIRKNPGARAALKSGSTYKAAAFALSGTQPGGYKKALERLYQFSETGADRQANSLQSADNQTEALLANDANGAETAGRRALGAAKDPGSAAVLAVANQSAQGLELMRKAVDSMSTMARLYDRLTGNRAALDYQAAQVGFAQGVDTYAGGR